MGSVIKAAESMERGELNIDIQVTSKDEFGRLAETFRRTTQALSSYIYEISENLNRLAQGDLRIAIEKDYKGDFEQIKTSLSDFTFSLSQTLSNINTASEQVSSAASQVSSGAQVLASGSTVQAASIEELSAAFEKISYQAAENSSNVKTATQFVGQVESTSTREKPFPAIWTWKAFLIARFVLLIFLMSHTDTLSTKTAPPSVEIISQTLTG